jgi:hypothetical protein
MARLSIVGEAEEYGKGFNRSVISLIVRDCQLFLSNLAYFVLLWMYLTRTVAQSGCFGLEIEREFG